MRHPARAVAPLLFILLAACGKAPAPEEPLRAVRTQVIEGSKLSATHEFAADVRPRTESRMSFRVPGKLVRRNVEVGEVVKPGQLLAQLDAQDLKLSSDAAQASLAAAKSSLELSEAEFKRYKELREQGFISGLELERREAALKAARAQAEQVRAQASVQGNQAGYANLTADAAGVVTAVDVEPGAVVSAGMTILRVAPDGPRDAVFSVPEDRVETVRAQLGRRDALRIRLWGQQSLIPGTVREVAAAADTATRTFLVKADIGQAAVRLGQTATVLLDTGARDNVIRVPLAAVFEQQGASQIWLLDRASMTVRPQRVDVAGADGNQVVIAGGLSAGQTIVTAGVHALMSGQRVRLYQEPAPALATVPAASRPGASTPLASATVAR